MSQSALCTLKHRYLTHFHSESGLKKEVLFHFPPFLTSHKYLHVRLAFTGGKRGRVNMQSSKSPRSTSVNVRHGFSKNECTHIARHCWKHDRGEGRINVNYCWSLWCKLLNFHPVPVAGPLRNIYVVVAHLYLSDLLKSDWIKKIEMKFICPTITLRRAEDKE